MVTILDFGSTQKQTFCKTPSKAHSRQVCFTNGSVVSGKKIQSYVNLKKILPSLLIENHIIILIFWCFNAIFSNISPISW